MCCETVKRFAGEEDGAGMVEYGLLLALLTLALVGIVAFLGSAIWGLFETTGELLRDPPDAEAGPGSYGDPIGDG